VAPSPARVVVADDDPLMRRLLRTLLGTRGLELVGEAADGCAACTLATSLRPDVVVLDRAMPVLDGLGAARAIRAALPACGIVLFSGHDGAAAEAAARAAGADRFVAKQDGVGALAHAVLALTPPAGAARTASPAPARRSAR
jgi:DNA-binding NarL/FixJ family response regulator